MAEPLATGNPVFDYQASHRVFALAVQRFLMMGGGAAFVLCLAAYRWAALKPAQQGYVLYGALAGAILFTAGIQWGFHWRKRLRANFRREYGL